MTIAIRCRRQTARVLPCRKCKRFKYIKIKSNNTYFCFFKFQIQI